MSKRKRYYYLRQSRIVHVCAVLNKQFSLRDWKRYTEINGWENSDKVVATVNGFDFNINDVCLNPKIPVEWNDGKHNFFRVKLCQLRDGRWNYGYDYWFIDGGGSVGANYPKNREKGFMSEKEAVIDCLKVFFNNIQWIRKKTQMCSVEYDDDGNAIDTSNYRTATTNKIEKALMEVQERFNPRQLSLFEL